MSLDFDVFTVDPKPIPSAVPGFEQAAGPATWPPSTSTLICADDEALLVQTAADERDGADAHLLILAASGLLLVFSLWWHYFDRTADGMLRSMPTTIIWGYGHYLVFAATAAIGSGLALAVDAVSGHTHLTHLQQGLAVGVPLAVWILTVWWLRVSPLVRGPAHVASPLAAVLVLAAAWTPTAVPLMALITAVLSAVMTSAIRRRPEDTLAAD